MCQKIDYCTLQIYFKNLKTTEEIDEYVKSKKWGILQDYEIIENYSQNGEDENEKDSVLMIDGSRKKLKFIAKNLLEENNQNISGFEIVGKCKCDGWLLDLDGNLENSYLSI